MNVEQARKLKHGQLVYISPGQRGHESPRYGTVKGMFHATEVEQKTHLGVAYINVEVSFLSHSSVIPSTRLGLLPFEKR